MTMADESALDFPCRFPIKLMGRHTADFRDLARALVERHAGPVGDEAIQASLSRNQRFVSITITITASSQAQLDAIYQDVSDHEDVLMAL